MKQDIETIVSKIVDDKQAELPEAVKVELAHEHLKVATGYFLKYSESLKHSDSETIGKFANMLMELLDKFGLFETSPISSKGYFNWCPYCKD